LSGRGMGLSIVAEGVRALGGSVRLEPATPYGAQVVLSAPLTTSRRSLIQVEVDGAVYALPGSGGARLLRLRADALESVEGHPAARIDIDGVDVVVPIAPLTALLSSTPSSIPTDAGVVLAVLISRGDRHLAIAVSSLTNVLPAMVQTMAIAGVEPSLSLGVAVLDDETPAVVLNPDALMDRWLRDHRRLAGGGLGVAEHTVADARTARTVLVVDDSITTRTLEKSILEAQGYRVLLAVDGLDALNTLRSGNAVIDLVVADIEMPRMDGFALLQAIKADAALSGLPVILMTSRAAPEDVRRGMDLGAEAYVIKQKFDQRELLATIGRVL
jgi:two-component system chemotaxis sensor kinase CheA